HRRRRTFEQPRSRAAAAVRHGSRALHRRRRRRPEPDDVDGRGEVEPCGRSSPRSGVSVRAHGREADWPAGCRPARACALRRARPDGPVLVRRARPHRADAARVPRDLLPDHLHGVRCAHARHRRGGQSAQRGAVAHGARADAARHSVHAVADDRAGAELDVRRRAELRAAGEHHRDDGPPRFRVATAGLAGLGDGPAWTRRRHRRHLVCGEDLPGRPAHARPAARPPDAHPLGAAGVGRAPAVLAAPGRPLLHLSVVMSTPFAELSPSERTSLAAELQARYDAFKARGLKLDMTRGKPSPEQLDLANGMLELPGAGDFLAADGTDTRNYGGVDGLPEMKALFAELLDVPPASVIVGGNASLQMMHDTVVRALLHGVPDGDAPWSKGRVKFLCPSPGYDRHFAICEHFGIEMIPIEMDEHGPDVEQIQKLVASDASIKGIWC